MNQMRIVFPIVVVSVFAVILGTTAMASDPDKDLVVKQWEGAPACDFVDGGVYVDNDSSSYYYRIAVTITAHVPDGGGTRECAGDPPSCSEKCDGEGTLCECSLSGAIFTYAPNAQGQKNGCALPNYQGECCTNCDNTSCDPASFCATKKGAGSYYYLQWSTDGINWTDFIDQTPISIITTQQSAECP